MRALFYSTIALAFLVVPSCTLLESKDGIAGPPIEEDDSATGDDAAVPHDARIDGTKLDSPAPGDDASDASVVDVVIDHAGQATATTLFDSQSEPVGVFADGTYVYWVAGSPRALLRGPRDGGDPTKIVHLDDINQPVTEAFDLVVDGTYVYWTKRSGSVLRRALDGGVNETCFDAGTSAGFIALLGPTVFLTDYRLDGTGSVFRGTCGQAPITLFASQPRSTGIATSATNGGHVFWGRNTNDQIDFGDLEGGAPSLLRSIVGAVGGVATDGAAVYWVQESQRIMRFELATQTIHELYEESAAFGDGDIAVDDSWVYWSETANSVIRRVPKLPLDGGP